MMRTEEEIRDKLKEVHRKKYGLREYATLTGRGQTKGWIEAMEWVLEEEE